MPAALSPDLLEKMDAYRRAANYLTVGQILRNSPMSFDLVEFDLAARPLCYELDSNDPGHNQSVDVSYFAQTPDGQRRNPNVNRYAIAKRSVFISTC
jgi:hypothetical protein